MSGLDVAAGVLGIVGLTAKVMSICWHYSQEVAHAKTDIERLNTQVHQLQSTLREIMDLLGDRFGTRLKGLEELRRIVKDCHVHIEKLAQKLKVGKGHKAMKTFGIRALKFPLSRPEVERCIEELKSNEAAIAMIIRINTGATVQKIDLDLVLAKLPCADGAAFDSYQNQHDPICHHDTRIDLLHEIELWIRNDQSKCVFWLSGMAGTGKSTVSRTLAHTLASQEKLGASFFFKRGEGDRGRAKRFFTTLASQLVRTVPQMMPAICEAIDATPNISEKQLKDQFEKLLLYPFESIDTVNTETARIVIIVDALDECEDEDDIKALLHLLSRAKAITAVDLRIFLTSRPELPIRLGFNQISEDVHQDVKLHEIPRIVVDEDISTFLNHELANIQRENSLSADWPGVITCQRLVQMASPLFIFAATICRFIQDSRWDPQDQLQLILEYSTQSHISKLDQTYLPVFDRLVVQCDNVETAALVKEFRTIVGPIVILEEPLDAIGLSKLLNLPQRKIDRRLSTLHSVLDVPTSTDKPIRLLHLSFRDFLLDPKKKDKFQFWIDQHHTHTQLAKHCLELLQQPGVLKQDICDLKSPGSERRDIDELILRESLPSHIQYAIRYWTHHLLQSKSNNRDLWNQAYIFLRAHFLHWLESMALIGRVLDSLAAIKMLQTAVTQSHELTGLATFLEDAKRFILSFRSIIETVPLQIYCSGLVFAPQKSIVRELNQNAIPQWMFQTPRVQAQWGAALATLHGHQKWITAIAFSKDGELLASASRDKTIRLWRGESGAEIATLKGHSEGVSAISFSPDSKTLASASFDNTVRLWDTRTGASVSVLRGHTGHVHAITFSSSGKRLASASADRTVRLWNIETGVEVAVLTGHEKEIDAVAFSPTEKLLVSASRDGTVKFWNEDTGAAIPDFGEALTLQGGSIDEQQKSREIYTHIFTAVTFSPNGRILASSSSENTVKLWDVATGAKIATLVGHTNCVNSLCFSPDGTRLASSSFDGIIRLWDGKSGADIVTISPHHDWISALAFSPDSKHLASAAQSTDVILWDSETGARVAALKGNHMKVDSIAFSPDGKQLASGCRGGTLVLWDALPNTETTTQGVPSSPVNLVFSADGKRLVSASYHGEYTLWDGERAAEIAVLEGNKGYISHVRFSSTHKLLVTASADGIIKLWNGKSGLEILILQGHSSAINDIAFSPDDKRLASASEDNTMRIWDSVTGKTIAVIEGRNSSFVDRIAFSPDSSRLASSSHDQSIMLFDAMSGEAVAQLGNHRSISKAFVFSPDSRFLATASSKSWEDGSLLSTSHKGVVRLWNVESGSLVAVFNGHIDFIADLAFSADSTRLASSSHDKTVRIWELKSGVEMATLNTADVAFKLSFNADGTTLKSTTGTIDFDPFSDMQHTLEDQILHVSDEWIKLGSLKLLHLPSEYRARCYATYGRKLVVGHVSRPLSHFVFDFEEMNRCGIWKQDSESPII